jgi:hypothetical protein
MEADLALRAVALPAAVAAVVAWLSVTVFAGRAARHALAGAVVRWLAVLLAVLPVAWAIAFQEGSAGAVLRPSVAFQWLGWAAAVAATVAAVGSMQPGRGACAVAGSVAALATCVMIRPPGLPGEGPRLAAALGAALAGAGMAIAFGGAREGPGPADPRRAAWPALAAWWAALSVGSGMVLVSGFAKLAVACGALGASAAAWAVLAAWFPRMAALAPAASAAFAATFGALVLVARGYDESGFPAWSWWALTASPGAACVAAWPALARRPRLRAVATVAAPALAAIAALAAAKASTAGGSASPSDYALARTAARAAP